MPEATKVTPEAEPEVAAVSKNQRFRKPKPWDHDGIDHWKEEEFKPADGSGAFLEESSFATLFPQYREKYLREVWPAVTSALLQHGVDCELNVVEGSMTVRTTRQTRDPFAVLKARDVIKLMARSVPVAQAVKGLRDGMQSDIVKIGGLVQNKERFAKRRERLLGPNGSTLKAVELLTECYILVQGNTVACMGGYKGLKQARRIIEDCMRNIHPVYNIKALMIKRELEKDDSLKETNWNRFLPKFKKNNLKKKKKPPAEDGAKPKVKKAYAAFPPLPVASKVDLQLESGEYFMKAEGRKRKKADVQKVEREEKAKQKRELRDAAHVAPDESAAVAGGKRGREDTEGGGTDGVMEMAERVKRKAKKAKKSRRASGD